MAYSIDVTAWSHLRPSARPLCSSLIIEREFRQGALNATLSQPYRRVRAAGYYLLLPSCAPRYLSSRRAEACHRPEHVSRRAYAS